MPLVQLWEKTPDIVLQYNIKQIVSAAGDGILADGSECSNELRHYLRNIQEEKLYEHTKYCLANSFERGPFALQDIVNELGRRLDYEVEDGLYKGRRNHIGFDGIWRAPNGHSIVIEIKTSDAYRINLDTVATYRNKLQEIGELTERSSILIVVGRDDTGDLEAQIRGSRHAWDVRIISMESLMKLVELKVKSDEDETTEKIRSLLVPFEYTRLDNIIDVMFTTAKDVEDAEEGQEESIIDHNIDNHSDSSQNHTPREILEAVRSKALDALGKREGVSLIAHKRTQFWSSDKAVRTVCPVSKKYRTGYYWYAFHPHQKNFLADGERSYFMLGCLENHYAYAIPLEVMERLLPHLHKTEKPNRSYWHIHLYPAPDGDYQLVIPNQNNLKLSKYAIVIESI